jgi:nicotinamidase-related amidase
MATIAYEKQRTALLVIDPYNDFISEGGKIWPPIKTVAEANNCVVHMQQVLNCRAAGEASRLLCNASSLPSGRLRDLEVYCAHSEGSVAQQELQIWHVGRGDPCRVRAVC